MMGFWFAVEELDAYTVQECLEALCIFTLIGKQTVTLVKGIQIKEWGAVMGGEAWQLGVQKQKLDRENKFRTRHRSFCKWSELKEKKKSTSSLGGVQW